MNSENETVTENQATTDIAARLRASDNMPDNVHQLCNEAAAEIERLRTLVEDALQGLRNDFEPDNQTPLYNRIQRALERGS